MIKQIYIITRFLFLIFVINCDILWAQNISGIVLNEDGNLPIEYVNIGVIKRNIGTVSDINGKYKLIIGSEFDDDTLQFSSIGYYPFKIKIAELKKKTNKNIFLKKKIFSLNEVIIKPIIFKPKTLGVTTKFKNISSGFKDNFLGYECGILMKVKKTAYIKSVNINIAYCSYDTIFYRLNIYKVNGEMDFENILKEPIYIKMSKDMVNNVIKIDLHSKNIIVDGDFLVTLEHVKDLGEGYLTFCTSLTEKTYYRKTSQGDWKKAPAGISISVNADVEK